MANKNGNAYGLTVLSPIINGSQDNESFSAIVRDRLQNLPLGEYSPLAKSPNTYLCRFYVLNDVFYQGYPAKEEHLKSKYLVFSSNFYGDRDVYLQGMWANCHDFIKQIWGLCVGFKQVNDARAFIEYITRCQINNNLFFNGSNDESLAEQLKGLYLKQELSKFVFAHQGKPAAELQQAFATLIEQTQPKDLNGPTWQAGATYHDNEAPS